MPRAFDTEQQAAKWLARLDADSSQAALALWAQWLREDTRHHAAYVRVEQGWRQAECFKSLRPLDGSVRVDLLDEIVGAPPDLHRHRPDAVRWWKRPGLLSRPPALYSALAVALGAGALASLLVLAGWHLLMTSP
jgi:ferric-dicitrate binding protein FerR (iron transport regulator)